MLSAAAAVCVMQIGNAVEFVKLLLDMREKYESTIAQAFSDDKNFKNTLNSVSSNCHDNLSHLSICAAAGYLGMHVLPYRNRAPAVCTCCTTCQVGQAHMAIGKACIAAPEPHFEPTEALLVLVCVCCCACCSRLRSL